MLFNQFRKEYLWGVWNLERNILLRDIKLSKKSADKALLKIWNNYDENVAKDLIWLYL